MRTIRERKINSFTFAFELNLIRMIEYNFESFSRIEQLPDIRSDIISVRLQSSPAFENRGTTGDSNVVCIPLLEGEVDSDLELIDAPSQSANERNPNHSGNARIRACPALEDRIVFEIAANNDGIESTAVPTQRTDGEPGDNGTNNESVCDSAIHRGYDVAQQQTSETVITINDSSDESFAASVSSNENEIDSDVRMIVARVPVINESRKKLCRKNNKEAKSNEVKDSQHLLVQCRSRGVCKELFENRAAMMFHLANYHAKGIKKIFECLLCRRTLKSRYGLNQHMNSQHDREIRYKRPIRNCSKIFTQRSSLEFHANAVHTRKSAPKCSKCYK